MLYHNVYEHSLTLIPKRGRSWPCTHWAVSSAASVVSGWATNSAGRKPSSLALSSTQLVQLSRPSPTPSRSSSLVDSFLDTASGTLRPPLPTGRLSALVLPIGGLR